jgi:hypothetical protein
MKNNFLEIIIESVNSLKAINDYKLAEKYTESTFTVENELYNCNKGKVHHTKKISSIENVPAKQLNLLSNL